MVTNPSTFLCIFLEIITRGEPFSHQILLYACADFLSLFLKNMDLFLLLLIQAGYIFHISAILPMICRYFLRKYSEISSKYSKKLLFPCQKWKIVTIFKGYNCTFFQVPCAVDYYPLYGSNLSIRTTPCEEQNFLNL